MFAILSFTISPGPYSFSDLVVCGPINPSLARLMPSDVLSR